MAEKQRLFRLGRGYNGFFCPESRFHLIGGRKPQDVYPAALPLSKAIIRGLRGGTLIDVNGVVTAEELGIKSANVAVKGDVPLNPTKPNDNPDNDKKEPQQPPIGDKEPDGDKEPNGDKTPDGNENPDGDKTPEGDKEPKVVVMTDEEIDAATKGTLLDFIKDNEIEDLGLNSRSTAEEVKEALKTYFQTLK